MPQDDLGATLDELQSLVAGVGVGDAVLPKPCVAGSNPAGGTTSYRAKSVLNSTNANQKRSCCLPLSATASPRLPPSAKPLRNGKPWVQRHQHAEACLRLATGMVRTQGLPSRVRSTRRTRLRP